jgi:hypothetical protein
MNELILQENRQGKRPLLMNIKPNGRSRFAAACSATSFTVRLVSGCIALSLFLICCSPVVTRATDYAFGSSTYAAIAYSTSTGECYYAWNYASRHDAESAALAGMNANDARIVGWVNQGWLVLIIGDDNSYGIGWQYGNGARLNVASQHAMNACLQHTNKIRKVIRLGSGNRAPEIVAWDPPMDASRIQFDN